VHLLISGARRARAIAILCVYFACKAFFNSYCNDGLQVRMSCCFDVGAEVKGVPAEFSVDVPTVLGNSHRLRLPTKLYFTIPG
jgi:hypothetical protein